MTGQFHDARTSIRLGRFRLEMPDVLQPTSEWYELLGVELELGPWPQEQGAAYDRLWRERIEEVEAGVDQGSNRRTRIVEEGKLVPGMRVVVYEGPFDMPEPLTAEALLRVDDSALWLRLSGRTASEMKQVLARLHASLRPASRRAEWQHEPDLFHVGPHAFAVPPGAGGELAEVAFRGSVRSAGGEARSVEMSAAFETTDAPEETTLLQRSELPGCLGRLLSIGLREFRAGSRVVGGLPGQEQIVGFSRKPTSEVLFQWEYVGEAGSPLRPRGEIDLRGAVIDLPMLTELWDRVLDSVRPVP
jgi:hypothetical protein